jgi:hypothetical protein
MKISIDQAISILSASAYAGLTTHDEKFKAAVGLGAEALKYLKEARTIYSVPLCLLPGEELPAETEP